MSNPTPPSRFSAQASAAQDNLRQAGRRGTGIVFAVMITVLLVALVFAANANTVIGWILVVISAGWLVLATVVVVAFSVSAKKVGNAVDSARADAAARRTQDYGSPATVVDEDTHGRNLKLDHSFKIVQVQVKVIEDELANTGQEDTEVIHRALETMTMTAHNGRDMLADLVGRSGNNHDSDNSASPDSTSTRDDDGGTISGKIL